MIASKRTKTKYAGVTFRTVDRLNGYGEERMYYIRYRRGGRGSKEIEEPVGRESEGMTAAKANLIRAVRIAGKEQSNTERRAAEEAARLAIESAGLSIVSGRRIRPRILSIRAGTGTKAAGTSICVRVLVTGCRKNWKPPMLTPSSPPLSRRAASPVRYSG